MKYKTLIFSFIMLISATLFAQNEINDTLVYKLDLPKNAENFSKGLENKYNENYDAAIKYFEEALKFNKDDDASMYELSELYLLKNRNTEAYTMIYNAVKLQPDNKWYKIRLASFYMLNSDYYAVIKIYDKLMADDPENLDYLQTYITALLRIGNSEKILAKLDDLEKIIGKNEMIYLQRMEIFRTDGNVQKMTLELEKLVSLCPSNTQYLAMLAQIYMNNNDNRALSVLMKIKEIDPENQYISISLYDYYNKIGEYDKAFDELISAIKNPNLDFETKNNVYEYWAKNNIEKNKKVLRKKEYALGNAFVETYPEKWTGYFILGTAAFDENNDNLAREYCHKALEYDSTNYMVYFQLCTVDFRIPDFDALIKDTENAITYYPEQPIFYFFKAMAYTGKEELENALSFFEKSRLFSGNKDLTKEIDIYIGDIANSLHYYKKSFDAYERVLRVDPDNILVLNNYAYNLAVNNTNLEKALEMSAKTIKAEPKNAMYLDTYAWVLFRLERFSEAKKWMQKVFKYEKKPSGVNYEHLGDILFKLGDSKGAMSNWKKAKDLGGASKSIDLKIEKGTYTEESPDLNVN